MKGMISLRLEGSLLSEVDKARLREGKSRTAFIKEALLHYLQYIERKEGSGGFVPFDEYKRLNEELKTTLIKVAKLENLVANLTKENETLSQELKKAKKKRWFFTP